MAQPAFALPEPPEPPVPPVRRGALVTDGTAGITRDALLHKMTQAQWREVLEVDLGGCFNVCRWVIEGMRARNYGRIINISSVNALSGQIGQVNCAAAKAGMLGLTRSLALESAAHQITVNRGKYLG